MKATSKQKPLTVRCILWHRNDVRSKLAMLMPDGWRPTKSYEAARKYAEQHGYRGIRVRII